MTEPIYGRLNKINRKQTNRNALSLLGFAINIRSCTFQTADKSLFRALSKAENTFAVEDRTE